VTAPRSSRAIVVAVATLALGSTEAFLVACRSGAPRNDVPGEDGGALRTDSSAATASEPPPPSKTDDGATSPAEGAQVGMVARDAGSRARPCDGREVSLLEAAVDPRCAISASEWSKLTRTAGKDAGGGAGETGALRQEARRDGDRIVVAIVNVGAVPAVVPLRVHLGHPELTFSVLAETEGHAVFELAPPAYDAPEETTALDAGVAGRAWPWSSLVDLDAGAPRAHVHHARIRLPPGGRASARIAVDTRVAKRLDRSCPESGTAAANRDGGTACLPAHLPRGPVVLYVGQLIVGTDAPPARVDWTAP
jgi:hypothetical protein